MAEKKNILIPITFAVRKGIKKSLPRNFLKVIPHVHILAILPLSEVNKRYYDPNRIIIIIIIIE